MIFILSLLYFVIYGANVGFLYSNIYFFKTLNIGLGYAIIKMIAPTLLRDYNNGSIDLLSTMFYLSFIVIVFFRISIALVLSLILLDIIYIKIVNNLKLRLSAIQISLLKALIPFFYIFMMIELSILNIYLFGIPIVLFIYLFRSNFNISASDDLKINTKVIILIFSFHLIIDLLSPMVKCALIHNNINGLLLYSAIKIYVILFIFIASIYNITFFKNIYSYLILSIISLISMVLIINGYLSLLITVIYTVSHEYTGVLSTYLLLNALDYCDIIYISRFIKLIATVALIILSTFYLAI